MYLWIRLLLIKVLELSNKILKCLPVLFFNNLFATFYILAFNLKFKKIF